MTHSTQLVYQKASLQLTDLQAFYRLRNEPRDLLWSGYKEPHAFESFEHWYKQQLRREDRTIWLMKTLETQQKTVGYLYLTQQTQQRPTAAVLSVGVSERYAGLGFASKGINFLLNFCLNAHNFDQIIAWIASENIASAKSFLHNGFLKTEISQKIFYESFDQYLTLEQYEFPTQNYPNRAV